MNALICSVYFSNNRENFELTEILIKNSDLNQTLSEGENVLFLAAILGYEKTTKILIKNGIDINI